MPDWFNSIDDAPVILLLVTAVIGALTFVINSKVDKVLHEMFPNSGASMRDAINRIETKLDNHIEWHMDRTES